MIRVDRSANAPDIESYTEIVRPLSDGRTKYKKERDKALAFFTNPAHYNNDEKLTRKTFRFGLYSEDDVKEELENVFGKKCAYCETDISAGAPREVEHYRPKNSIEIHGPRGKQELKPGYYWLAADWDNLLISCIDCNRRRGHDIAGETKRRTIGKLSLFPLENETLRVRSHLDDLGQEDAVRLLLNPCHDQPEEHLQFKIDGTVKERRRNGQPSNKGKTSIEVLALRRVDLVHARKEHINRLRDALLSLQEALLDRNDLDPANTTQSVLDRNEARLQRDIKTVATLLTPKAEYLGAKREVIRQARDDGRLNVIQNAGIDLIALSGAEDAGL